MGIGKSPHRIEGKAKDAEHMTDVAYTKGVPYDAPSQKDVARLDREEMRRRGGPSRFPAEEQVGGSRPGVESRVKDAIDKREAREG